MALTANLEFTSEVIDGDSFLGTYTDSTTYGGANPVRAGVAVYLTIEKIKADTTTDYDVDVNSYNPETATDFTFPIEVDGWYKAKFVIIPDYDNAASYVQYDVVYSSGVVYRATQATSGNPPPNNSFWEVISEPTSLVDNDGSSTESQNLVFQIKQDIIYPFAKTCYGDKTSEAAIDCCSTCERSEKILAYEYIGVLVDGMDVANQRGQYSRGEKISLKAQEFCDC